MNEAVYTSDYREGTAALHAGRLTDAITAFERVTEDSPCWVMAQGNIGLAQLRMDSYKQAETQLQRSLSEIEGRGCPHPPAQVQFMRNLAEAIGKQGRRAEAIQGFAKACEVADRLATDIPDLNKELAREKAHVLNSCGMVWLLIGKPQTAISAFNSARDIYQLHADENRTGHAEVLTNLAIALAQVGKTTSAELALSEAIDILQITGDSDQLFRTLIVAAEMGSSLVQADRVLELIEAGAEESLANGRPATAYLRYCQGASFATKADNFTDAAKQMVRRAREIEDRLESVDLHVPKLRYVEALVRRLDGEPMSRVTEVLIEGAHEWYKQIAVPLIPADFLVAATDLHQHLRLLADCLLECDRVEEALVAFDAGRALHYAVQVDPAFHSQVVSGNPFAADGSEVDVTSLRNAQRYIDSKDVEIVLAVVPPRLISFIIGRDRIEYIRQQIAATPDDLPKLTNELKLVPHRLAAGAGIRAIPPAIRDFTRMLVQQIGDRSVSAFIPYDALHLIPWRAVLHQAGLPWQRLTFTIGFNFLLRRRSNGSPEPGERKVVALGHGAAGTVNLEEEAKQFAEAFGSQGEAVLRCTAADVRSALQSNSIILLSCHGKATNDEGDLYLELRGGSVSTEEVFPKQVASPLVILSACDSGVYFMAWSDSPMGAAPTLIRRGATCVIGARFPLNAQFAAEFFASFALLLATGTPVRAAFANTMSTMDATGARLWKDLACLEMVSGF